MPRQMRVEFAGAIFHVLSRGDQRQDIFFDDVDRKHFLKALAETCQKTDWQVHSFVSGLFLERLWLYLAARQHGPAAHAFPLPPGCRLRMRWTAMRLVGSGPTA